MIAASSPIGIFDSGVGGLSVLQHIHRLMPAEALIYVADSGYAPYGEKTDQFIAERSLAIAGFLQQQQIKALVVACNTATAAAVHLLRQRYPELIIIGLEPGLKPAALSSQQHTVAVLATRSTLNSRKFQHLLQQTGTTDNTRIVLQPCDGLAAMIEQGRLDSPQLHELLQTYLQPAIEACADRIVLGCTHYPFVSSQIQDILAQRHPHWQQVELIDTGAAVARHLQQRLQQAGCLAQPAGPDTAQPAALQAYTSGSLADMQQALLSLLHLTAAQMPVQALPLTAASMLE